VTRSRSILLAVFLAWLAWLLAQVTIALVLRVEGYDGYWYLSNAWYLAGGPVSHYEDTKAPLLSLIYVPLFVLRRLGAPELLAFAGSHLISVSLTLACGVLLARLLRTTFSAPLSWAAAFAFLGSRVVFRYGAFAMSDLPTTLFVLAALEAVRRAQGKDGWRARLPFALAATAALLTRYPSGLVIPLAVAWDAWNVARDRRSAPPALRRLLQHAGTLGLALTGAMVLHLAVYARPFGGLSGSVAALVDMFARNTRLGGISVRGFEPWWEYLPVLAISCTLPLVALMAAGLVTAARHGGRTEALHALWVAAHLGFVSLVSSHKEARYMLPALPSLFLFLLWGLRGLRMAAERLAPGRLRPAVAQVLAVSLLLAAGLVSSAREGRMLSQPFFRTPHQARIAAWVSEAVPSPGRFAWVGNFYPLVPPKHVFDIRDEYYYVYHLAPHVLEYYMGRPVRSWRDGPSAEVDGALYPLRAGHLLTSGDGLLSSTPEVTVTANLPPDLPPLLLSTVTAVEMIPEAPPGRSGGAWRGRGDPATARLEPGSLELASFPGATEIILRQADRQLLSLGIFPVEKGSETVPLPQGLDLAGIRGLQLVRYAPRPVPGTGAMVRFAARPDGPGDERPAP